MSEGQIKTVYFFPSGIAEVKDADGNNLVEFQGKITKERYARIMTNLLPDAKIHGSEIPKRIIKEQEKESPENMQLLIAEARRELKMREQLYPEWILQNRISAKTAAHRITCMIEIVETLEKYNQIINQGKKSSQIPLF